jgi:hypothetical protein
MRNLGEIICVTGFLGILCLADFLVFTNVGFIPGLFVIFIEMFFIGGTMVD